MRNAIESSIEVITSEGAFSVPDRGSRWKWDGPWWHLAIMFEMGEVARDSPVSCRQRVGAAQAWSLAEVRYY